MRRAFREHRGHEVDHAGDGFFVVFESARDATDCAITIQRRLDAQRRMHGYAPEVRIGIHVGDVSTSESSVRGAAVHRASRLCAAARPGSIRVSREALEVSGLKAAPLHRFELKGVREQVQAAELTWEGA